MGRQNADLPLTSTHWGTYAIEVADGKVKALHDFSEDPSPSPIGHGIVDVLDGPTRIDAPMIRKGWLENGPGSTDKRGKDAFVRVSWDEAERLVADELKRVSESYGNQAIYAGSYGWASAGRFHHAQSQIHRFLNCIGGYTRSLNTYSFAAAEVVVPHVLGGYREFVYPGISWPSVIENTELVVAFGGIPVKNGQISQGGIGRHVQPGSVEKAAAAGVKLVSISPLRSDMMDVADAQWLTPRPSTDAAILIGLAHTLLSEKLHDQAFLDKYTVGFDQFASYLDGTADGTVKSAEWAAEVSGLNADDIRKLARRMASNRTVLSVSWSLTRQDHGEQPFWAAITLAAMLGQMGLPGGGVAFGYSAVNSVGHDIVKLPGAALPQGKNNVEGFIPVARISDMLLNPGSEFDYDGQRGTYPDTKIVYWAGGNPFHHHQDLNRLRKAWQRPDTVICHEWCWNALAKNSDIVLPCTTNLEREDVAFSPLDNFMVHMSKVVEPNADALDDYTILSKVARQMGVYEEFTEERSPNEWIELLYNRTRQSAAEKNIDLPTFQELKEKRWYEVPPPKEPSVTFVDFRKDPAENPLQTPSGKIEIFSETIAGFHYDDCPGHAKWMEPAEWLGNASIYPLHLISNQPKNKLHSQLDHGSVSRAGKINGREPMVIHPNDAVMRGIQSGDVVRVFNSRGACYCSAVLDDSIMENVICVSTGAWFDPVDHGADTACKHGNPNMLTLDKGGSSLAQGPIAHTCLVDVERSESPPPVTAFDPPEILDRTNIG